MVLTLFENNQHIYIDLNLLCKNHLKDANLLWGLVEFCITSSDQYKSTIWSFSIRDFTSEIDGKL
jgi:hypothetical protein